MIRRSLRAIAYSWRTYLHAAAAISATATLLLLCLVLGAFGRSILVAPSSITYGNAVAAASLKGDAHAISRATADILALRSVRATYVDRAVPITLTRTAASYKLNARQAADASFGYSTLIEGAFPHAANEVAVNAGLAEERTIAVGDRLTITVGTTSGQTASVAMKVSGIYAENISRPAHDPREVLVTTATMASWDALANRVEETTIYVLPAFHTSGIRLVADMATVQDITAHSRSALGNIPEDRRELAGRWLMVVSLLSGLMILAVSATLTYNALRAVVMDRSRELANLHELGLSASAIRRGLNTEQAIVSLVSAAFGTVVGVLGARFIPAVLRAGPGSLSNPTTVTIEPQFVVAAFVVAAGVGLFSAKLGAHTWDSSDRLRSRVRATVAVMTISSFLLGSGVAVIESSRERITGYLRTNEQPHVDIATAIGTEDPLPESLTAAIDRLPQVESITANHAAIVVARASGTITALRITTDLAHSLKTSDGTIVLPYDYEDAVDGLPTLYLGSSRRPLSITFGPVSVPTVTAHDLAALAPEARPILDIHVAPGANVAALVTSLEGLLAGAEITGYIRTDAFQTDTSMWSLLQTIAWFYCIAIGTMFALAVWGTSICLGLHLRTFRFRYITRYAAGESRSSIMWGVARRAVLLTCGSSIVAIVCGAIAGSVAIKIVIPMSNISMPYAWLGLATAVQCVTLMVVTCTTVAVIFRESARFLDVLTPHDPNT